MNPDLRSAAEKNADWKNLEPVPGIKEDLLKLHILYLEKLDHLSKGEREAYEKFLNHSTSPMFELNPYTGEVRSL